MALIFRRVFCVIVLLGVLSGRAAAQAPAPEQLDEALRRQAQRGGRLMYILENRHLIFGL